MQVSQGTGDFLLFGKFAQRGSIPYDSVSNPFFTVFYF